MPLQQQHTCCIPRFNQVCRCQSKKVDKVVDIVLTQNADSSRLITKIYLCQGHGNRIKGVAEYHIASELSAGSCTNMALHSDGTLKLDHSYITQMWICLLGPSGSNVVSKPQTPRLRHFLRFHDLIKLISWFWKNLDHFFENWS